MSRTFEDVPDKPHFPTEEEKVLKYWKETDAFQTALKQSKGKKKYVFYDGPPFATGLPHYGHILAGTIKDVVTRYQHMNGYHVGRRFGWDCHGLPVEYEIDKKLGISGRPDVLKLGIDKYNEECRSIVTRYTKEWREIVERFGRWIDFDNDYKTMDLSYMESVWNVFKVLFDKGQVYRAFRVMPFSTACNTPLSNFETSQNYKEVSDPSIIVAFKIKNKKDSYFLAWTTTPWTLPSNLALCCHPKLTYLRVKVKADGNEWFCGKDRFAWICQCLKKDPKKDFEILEEMPGKKLEGTEYEPLFPYLKSKANLDKSWRILNDEYVTTEAGTCIVHQAPQHGEDDNRVCIKYGVADKTGAGMPIVVDDCGKFIDLVTDFKGQHVKEADNAIKAKLKSQGSLIYSGSEVHNYPHCWRSDTPLIYKAVPSWFVKVEEVRDKLIANNDQTYWVPDFVKAKRFHNWLAEARDWCVSRNRYWGTPVPLWCSSDFEEIVCIGSVAELEKYAGRKITDIHRHFIDDIEIPSKKGKGMLKRVDEVFDCWFESGSMPYAQEHYPFERKEEFEETFPANFICEGLDQTRGWFYTLMVLSTHMFNKPAWKNLITNGLVLAADGKKMSKRLKNYPDPVEVVNRHGADAVRLYMCNSPVVRAEPLKFKEDGVKDVVKDVFLPWYNAYRFFIQESFRYEASGKAFKPDTEAIKKSKNTMDMWIYSSLQSLIKFVQAEMDAYRLYTCVPELVRFLNNLTNWYVRLNRDRMRGSQGEEDSYAALCTLYTVLLNVNILLAPLIPFITDMIYQNLARALPKGHHQKHASVHHIMMTPPDTSALKPEIEEALKHLQSAVELGRLVRERRKVGLKTPLREMTIANKDGKFQKNLQMLEFYLKEELNVMEVKYVDELGAAELTATVNFKIVGKKVGKDMKKVQEEVGKLGTSELESFQKSGKIEVCGHTLTEEDLAIARKVKALDNPNLDYASDDEFGSMVVLDFKEEPDLMRMAAAREVCNRVQKMRKEAKLRQDDPVDMWAEVVASNGKAKSKVPLADVLTMKGDYINKQIRRELWSGALRQGHELVIAKEDFDIDGETLRVTLSLRTAFFNPATLKKLSGGDAKVEEAIKQYAAGFNISELESMAKGPGLKARIKDKVYDFKPKTDFTVGVSGASWVKK